MKIKLKLLKIYWGKNGFGNLQYFKNSIPGAMFNPHWTWNHPVAFARRELYQATPLSEGRYYYLLVVLFFFILGLYQLLDIIVSGFSVLSKYFEACGVYLDVESSPKTMPGIPAHHLTWITDVGLLDTSCDAKNRLRTSWRLVLYSITSLFEQPA